MCWNKDVSLNTFLFSGFVLLLIIYNNYFTKYKIQLTNNNNNTWMYIFFASIIFIQLIEFFIWKNLNDPFYNNVFSILALALLIFQPVASIMLLSNAYLRNAMIMFYLLFAIPFLIYNFSRYHINAFVNNAGNLVWDFYDTNIIPHWCIWSVWLFFFLFHFVYDRILYGYIFALVTLFVVFLNYRDLSSIGSKWCWIANSIMIYLAFYLLIYLPFLEKSKLC
jgi:hypothetical protein